MRIADWKIGTKITLGVVLALVIVSGATVYLTLGMDDLAAMQDAAARRASDLDQIVQAESRLSSVYTSWADGVTNHDDLSTSRQLLGSAASEASQVVSLVEKLVDTDEERRLAQSFGAKLSALPRPGQPGGAASDRQARRGRRDDRGCCGGAGSQHRPPDRRGAQRGDTGSEPDRTFAAGRDRGRRPRVRRHDHQPRPLGDHRGCVRPGARHRPRAPALALDRGRARGGGRHRQPPGRGRPEGEDRGRRARTRPASCSTPCSNMMETAARRSSARSRGASDGLASAAGQVATAQALSQGTSEQAASVEETTASLEEMSASSRRTPTTAGRSSRWPQGAGRGGERPRRRETVDAMKDIAEQDHDHRGDRLPDEPAGAQRRDRGRARRRARQGLRGGGDRGAQAGRAQPGAAKEIGSLSRPSVAVAERSGELLEELVPAIRKTAELVQEVAAASREQASGVAQINTRDEPGRPGDAAQRLGRRGARSTAEEMASQAEALEQLVAFFRVDEARRGAGARARTAAPAQAATRGPATASAASRPTAAPRANGNAHPVQVQLHDDQHFRKF